MTLLKDHILKGINLAKPAKFYLLSEQVNIHIPLPQRTCSNWSSGGNSYDNIGVIYKGSQVTLRQLQYIIKCYENIADRDVHALLSTSVQFDGHTVTFKNINDVKRIFGAVSKIQPRDEYGYMRDFKENSKIVL